MLLRSEELLRLYCMLLRRQYMLLRLDSEELVRLYSMLLKRQYCRMFL
jgi:hypothetical protein